MNNMDAVVGFFFKNVSENQILNDIIWYNDFPKEDFERLALEKMSHLSDTEGKEIYSCLSMSDVGQPVDSGINVFRLLKCISDEILYVRNDEPVCKYSELLRWRALVKNLGEDLPICAYLSLRTERSGSLWNDFEWNTVIANDHMQLNRILQRGISDNHFHLFGSAPAFSLSWINLMNDLTNNRYATGLRQLDAQKRVNRIHYSNQYHEDSLEMMHFQAALIRAILFWYIRLIQLGGKNAEEQIREIKKEKVRIQTLLTDDLYLFYAKQNVQVFINSLHMYNGPGLGKKTDYAADAYPARGVNHDFEGERALLYHMLNGQVNHVPIPEFLINWFYAYLVIKGKLYEELVQVNDTVGFANFSIYNHRKGLFLHTNADDEKMVCHAVGSSFSAGNMKSLEARITPRWTVRENREMIRDYDRYIEEVLKERTTGLVYYVFHFPKKEDEKLNLFQGFTQEYRHYRFRRQLEQMGDELIRFRERSPREAARVLGIDACSMEIGCRPEVFGPVFRRLTRHVVPAPNLYGVKQWKITYHVGEDWLDIVDGLRAIDEAVLFLDMKNGDRFGHATVLGIDVKKWYEFKYNHILIRLQDYLDNIVWLYQKLLEFDIPSCETLKGHLLNEYEKYFYQIYGQYLDGEFIEAIIQKNNGQIGKSRGNGPIGQHTDYYYFNIHAYYEAWKLRGDAPSLYSSGYYSNPYSLWQEHMVNDNIPYGDELRRNVQVEILLFYYHYSADVRHAGEAIKQIAVPDFYIEGVRMIQKAMQQFVAEKGISIETNPSSNYLISTIKRYEDHPISNLYNMGLTMDCDELKNCPQLHVSINTDDKGVFNTSLENEFALMGAAMENALDVNDNKKYNGQMVLDWLDHIREHGNQQSFCNKP